MFVTGSWVESKYVFVFEFFSELFVIVFALEWEIMKSINLYLVCI